MKINLDNNKGYTLIEVMVVVAILGIIMGVMTMTVNTIYQDFKIGRDDAVALRQVQTVGYWITNDIKRAKTVATNVPGVFLSLQCYYWDDGTQTMIDDQQVDYIFNNGKLSRVIGGASVQIAEFIDQANTTVVQDAIIASKYILTVKSVYGNKQETRQYGAIQRVSG